MSTARSPHGRRQPGAAACEKHPGGFDLLESKEVAVLVADIDMEAENYLVFFNLLKNKYPQILVVVLTSASDSELVIHLINEAQIYRFLNKPVNLSLMQQYLHSASGALCRVQGTP